MRNAQVQEEMARDPHRRLSPPLGHPEQQKALLLPRGNGHTPPHLRCLLLPCSCLNIRKSCSATAALTIPSVATTHTFCTSLPPRPAQPCPFVTQAELHIHPEESASAVCLHSDLEALPLRSKPTAPREAAGKAARAEGKSKGKTAVQEIGLTVTARDWVVFIYVMSCCLATKSQPKCWLGRRGSLCWSCSG